MIILAGRPKSGKSTLMASLDNNLIIDLEDGYRALDVMVVNAHTAQEIFEIRNAIQEKVNADGKLPYRFITIDNATRLEEMALAYAAVLCRKTPLGTGFGFKRDKLGAILKDSRGNKVIDPKADVRDLPNGAGY